MFLHLPQFKLSSPISQLWYWTGSCNQVCTVAHWYHFRLFSLFFRLRRIIIFFCRFFFVSFSFPLTFFSYFCLCGFIFCFSLAQNYIFRFRQTFFYFFKTFLSAFSNSFFLHFETFCFCFLSLISIYRPISLFRHCLMVLPDFQNSN